MFASYNEFALGVGDRSVIQGLFHIVSRDITQPFCHGERNADSYAFECGWYEVAESFRRSSSHILPARMLPLHMTLAI